MNNIKNTHSDTYKIANDVRINRFGYGAMRITGKGVWGAPKDKEEALRVLKRAVELGINFIDTADSYGPNVSEELIAEALYPYPADLVIATKGGFMRSGPDKWTINADPAHLQQVLEGSLKRLRLEQIFLYQLHRVDPKVPLEKTLAFLKGAQEKGQIKHIGLSEVGVEEIRKAMEIVSVVSVQNAYSYGNRKWENVLTFCEDNNIAFIPWYPMDGGAVNGVDKLEIIAKKHSVTKYQVVLAWLLHRSPNILLIPGTSSVKHLEENFAAASLELSPDDIAELAM